ncbi:MAG: hypothetical protein H0U74_21175 [Bradymonadaceae bacterium]|nr:hypothetical protein [Lujinxingiaceae bacterium]
MKRLLAVIGLMLALAVPAPASASDDFSILPLVSPYFRTGFGAYRSTACPCFDRSTWNFDLGANLRWHRLISVDGEYRYGTILLGGNFPFSGYAFGLRSALTPQSERWWDEFYLRAGLGWLSIMGTRDRSYMGVYLHPGWAYQVFSLVHLETELSLSYYFGDMEHLNVGFRTGVRIGF